MPRCDEGKSTFSECSMNCIYAISCRVKLVKIVFDDSGTYIGVRAIFCQGGGGGGGGGR